MAKIGLCRNGGLIVALAVISSLPLTAKPRTAKFDANPDTVFAAAMRVAAKHYRIKYSDKETRTYTFECPQGFFMYAYDGSVLVEPDEGRGSIVTFNGKPATMASSSHIAKLFFGWLEDELGESAKKPDSGKSKKNRAKDDKNRPDK
jgi:hypothetical protein